jgi:hypothetical protein
MAGWIGWDELGGQFAGGSPVVGRNADGRLEVFAEALTPNDHPLWHTWQLLPGGPWII